MELVNSDRLCALLEGQSVGFVGCFLVGFEASGWTAGNFAEVVVASWAVAVVFSRLEWGGKVSFAEVAPKMCQHLISYHCYYYR